MADPEVLHTNPNVPIDEDGTGSEAIFAGLNDEHVLLVQAQSLVGRSDIVDGAAHAIIPVAPLTLIIDAFGNEQLVLDQSAFNASNTAMAALTARLTADEALIAANAAAINANASAIAANNAAIAANAATIAALQQQVTTLSQQLADLSASIKSSALQPVGRASLFGAGRLGANLGLTTTLPAFPQLAGAGGLGVNLTSVPKVLVPVGLSAAGNLAPVTLGLIGAMQPYLFGFGNLQVDALVKSLYILPGQWGPIAGAGQLLAPSLAMLRLLNINLAGSGALGALVNMPMIAGSTFTGAGAVLPTNLMKSLGGASFAGAGNMPAVTATIPPHTVQLDYVTGAAAVSTGTGTGSTVCNISTGNAALVIVAYPNAGKGDISSGITATWGSQAMTLVGNHVENTAQMQFLFFGLLAPSTTGGRITVTVAGMSTLALYTTIANVAALTFNNVNQSALTTAFNNFNSSTGAGSSLSLSITSPNSNSMVVAVSGSTGTAASVVGVDHTQWYILNGTTMSCSGQYATSAGTSTTLAVSFTSAPQTTGMYGLSVNN